MLGGDLINLKIKPEVSSLDFNNAVVIEGFRIPALTSRRTETEVELRDGQTFAIAGLLNNTALSSMRKVPGLGDIPILGYLFKSRAYTKDQTELVVMVTPQIVRRDSTGVSSGLPSLVEPFLGTERQADRSAWRRTSVRRIHRDQAGGRDNNVLAAAADAGSGRDDADQSAAPLPQPERSGHRGPEAAPADQTAEGCDGQHEGAGREAQG